MYKNEIRYHEPRNPRVWEGNTLSTWPSTHLLVLQWELLFFQPPVRVSTRHQCHKEEKLKRLSERTVSESMCGVLEKYFRMNRSGSCWSREEMVPRTQGDCSWSSKEEAASSCWMEVDICECSHTNPRASRRAFPASGHRWPSLWPPLVLAHPPAYLDTNGSQRATKLSCSCS